MKEIKVIGLDLAKNVFQVHGMDATGGKVVGKKLKRGEVLNWFAQQPPVLVGMDILRSKSPEMARKEVAVHLLAYNLIRSLMVRAAVLAHVLPRALSFKATLQLWHAFSQQWRWHPGEATESAVTAMLRAISTRIIVHRPDRIEPHAVKRRPTTHAYLTVPRDQARAAILEARKSLKVVP